MAKKQITQKEQLDLRYWLKLVRHTDAIAAEIKRASTTNPV